MFIKIITITVSVLLGFFAFGFLGIYFSDFKKNRYKGEPMDSHRQKSELSEKIVVNKEHFTTKKFSRDEIINEISKFFDVVLPLEFTCRPWYSKFWLRILERHPYIAYLAPAEGRENYTAKKWMCMAFELLNIMFVDSIFAPIASPDAEVCSKFTTAADCLKPSSIDLIDPLCSWNSEEKSCEFREIDENMGVIIISVLIIKLVEFPLMSFCEYLVDQVGTAPPAPPGTAKETSDIILSISSPRAQFSADEFSAEASHSDDFNEKSHVYLKELTQSKAKVAPEAQESTQVLFRLAARLSYLQHHVDRVTVEEEVAFLMTHADHQFKSDVIADLRLVFDSSGVAQRNYNSQRNREILKLIQRSRDMSRTVLKEIEEQHSQEEKEIYLVKRFIVELLKGVHRSVAERFFFDEVECEISVRYRVFCTMLLILIICGELTYVFLTGVDMGANATRVWFICLAVVVMQGECSFFIVFVQSS